MDITTEAFHNFATGSFGVLVKQEHILAFLYKEFYHNNVTAVPEIDLARRWEDFEKVTGATVRPPSIPARKYIEDTWMKKFKWLRNWREPKTNTLMCAIEPIVEQVFTSFERATLPTNLQTPISVKSTFANIVDTAIKIDRMTDTDMSRQLRNIEEEIKKLIKLRRELKNGKITKTYTEQDLQEKYQYMIEQMRQVPIDINRLRNLLKETHFREMSKIFASETTKKGDKFKLFMEKRNEIEESVNGNTLNTFLFMDSYQNNTFVDSILKKICKIPQLEEKARKDDPRGLYAKICRNAEEAVKEISRMNESMKNNLMLRDIDEEKRAKEVLRSIILYFQQHRNDKFDGITLEDRKVLLTSYNVPLTFESSAKGIKMKYVKTKKETIDLSNFTKRANYIKMCQNITDIMNKKNTNKINIEEILEAYPLEHGLEELLFYMSSIGGFYPAEINKEKNITTTGEDNNIIYRYQMPEFKIEKRYNNV